MIHVLRRQPDTPTTTLCSKAVLLMNALTRGEYLRAQKESKRQFFLRKGKAISKRSSFLPCIILITVHFDRSCVCKVCTPLDFLGGKGWQDGSGNLLFRPPPPKALPIRNKSDDSCVLVLAFYLDKRLA